ncbi:MAG: L,D-transpeptidase family protein [Bdellovibrionales bacterium]
MARLLFLFLIVTFVTPVLAAYDKPYIGEIIKYRAKHEDTFVHLARDYNLGFTEMRAANPYVDPWLPGKGTELILPARHLLPDAGREGVVINLPEMRLYAFIHGDDAPSTFPIGIGREGLNTPEGITKVTRKKEGPTWTPTPRMRREDPELKPYYPPGPDNPLGTHALYLGWPTYAIHGTNKPFGIGRRISSGCIRMYPENIQALYELIPVGTRVQVVNQPIKLAWINNRLYLEAHPEMEQAIQMEEYGVVSAPKLSEEDLKRIIRVAGANEEKLRWPAIRMAIKERAGYPVEIARRSGSFSEKDEAEIIKEAEDEVVGIDDQSEQDNDALEDVAMVEEASDSDEENVPNEQTNGQDAIDEIIGTDIEDYIPVQESGLTNTNFNP